MAYLFKKHYTRDEARALLPRVREWLNTLSALRRQIVQYDQQISDILNEEKDAGGAVVNRSLRVLADFKKVAMEFQDRQIQIKDLDRGLIDFPAIIGGKEVFLCWEQDEEDIEFWHDLETGYAGREKL
jgi:hypothetical protein